jgi:hypothetical protein
MKEVTMGWVCGGMEDARNAYRVLVGKSLRKLPLGKPRRR